MKVWGPLASFAFAFLAFVLGQAVGFAATLALVQDFTRATAESNGTAIAVSTLISNPVQIVTLVLAAQLTGTPAIAYLGVDVPRWRDFALVGAVLLAVIAVADGVTFALGKDVVPAVQIEQFRLAQADGALPWLLLATIVVAPIGEELLFRGFLFRGFVREPQDAWPAVILIALIWSILHVQYDVFTTAVLFLIGVLLGFVRWRTGSTTLAILMHMLLNLESTAETMFVMRWMS
jgi:membrane protease YdiL (CAAX protease family)